jgi:hypothetical protein
MHYSILYMYLRDFIFNLGKYDEVPDSQMYA